MTQDAACEPNGKPASFQGVESVLWWGGGGSMSGLMGGDGKVKRKRGEEFIPTVMMFCSLTLQCNLFLAELWGKEASSRG